MKKLIIKNGYFLEVTPKENKKIDTGIDLNLWLRNELKRIGVPVSDPCCNDVVVTPSGTDTRLSNPHITGNNLVFDILNATTLVVTPNAVSVALPTDSVVSMAVVGNNLTYTTKAGTTTTLALPTFTETPITAVDSTTIDFSTSGTANHTITAVVKPSTTNGQVLTTVGGIATWATPASATPTEKEDVFGGLNSGTTVTATFAPTNIPFVFRNGRYQREGVDYTRAGVVYTFATAFGLSGGGTNPEEVIIRYFY